MKLGEFVIYFQYDNFENKGFVKPIEAKSDPGITYSVEVDFDEHIIYKAADGWVDLYGSSNEFIIAMGNSIENHINNITNGTIAAKNKILAIIRDYNLKHAVHDFPSGCSMIDIWMNEDFVVIQVEPERFGFSIVKEQDFSTIADEYFTDLNIVSEKLINLVGNNRPKL